MCFGLVLGAVVAACGPGSETTEGATTGDETGPTDPTTPTTGDVLDTLNAAVAVNRDIDILFVIDNSGSMAEEQAVLAKSIAALIDPLAAAGASYRVAVTTTDSGNPRCPSATYTPEAGKLVLSSCLDRIDQKEFQFGEDDFGFACTDVCNKRDADLEVLATGTAGDPQAKPRRWVEVKDGVSNIAGGSAVEALQCYLPQGVAGCGFESHLESMYLALARSGDDASVDNYGFVREAAQLAVVIVSDEADCSYAQEGTDIFTSNKVFWSDPDAPAPTSALCWRAGVACTGDGPTYSECHAQNYSATGAPIDEPATAVLQPVSKYVDFVRSIERDKKDIDEPQRVKVALISGVPVGYEDLAAEIPYEDSPDPTYQANFGVGPGCVLGDPNTAQATAVPPVREREFAEAFNIHDAHRNLYSICQNDYSGALAAIAGELVADIMPTCMPYCIKDQDPETLVVDPACTLHEYNIAEESKTEIAGCIEENGEWAPPAGATVCFAVRVDNSGEQTASSLDDMSPRCVDEGYNVEFFVVRSAPALPGATITANCALSDNRMKDCPKL